MTLEDENLANEIFAVLGINRAPGAWNTLLDVISRSRARDSNVKAEFPEGAAFIERVGWEDIPQLGKCFTATLVFPKGVPPITWGAVWDRTPFQLSVVMK